MSMFYSNAMRGYCLGAKYGIMEGLQRYQHTTETPKMDDSAMQGAIGIIIAVGGVLIALYIIAVVVGSISYAVTSGNIKLSPTWNTTITKESRVVVTKQKFGERFAFGEYRFTGASNVQPCKRSANRHYWGRDSDDCDRRIQWSWGLSITPDPTQMKRTLNTAIA
jgi:hypothetical protein